MILSRILEGYCEGGRLCVSLLSVTTERSHVEVAQRSQSV